MEALVRVLEDTVGGGEIHKTTKCIKESECRRVNSADDKLSTTGNCLFSLFPCQNLKWK